MLYLIADTHFYHKNIIKYCNRPFKSVEEMNQKLIDNWNRVVSDDDIIIHLGDFALGSEDKIQGLLSQLNGYKVLVRGNHDKSIRTMKRLGFNEVFDGPLKINGYIFSHYPLYKTGYFTVNISVDNFLFTPVPLQIIKNIIYCGHCHNNWIARYTYEDKEVCSVW